MPAEGIGSMAALSATDTVVVITGGDPVDRAHLAEVPAGACVIAADSGMDHAVALGLAVDHVVGDMDSVSPEGLAAATDGGATVAAVSIDRLPLVVAAPERRARTTRPNDTPRRR